MLQQRKQPHILFLQGMPSPFFRRIARGLEAQGWRVSRIHLCPGDELFWRDGRCYRYRGRYQAWPAYLSQFYRDQQITHLLLLGENRRYHREAVALAKEEGIQVWVTDFGYLRPDWLAFEQDGMSGGSRFPRDRAAIRSLAAMVDAIDWTPRFKDRAQPMVLGDLAYNFANLGLGFLYPHYRRSDCRPPTIPYTLASARRLVGNRLLQRRVERQIETLSTGDTPYFLFPLQLWFDFQIVSYSPFENMTAALRMVLSSFAEHAPEGTLLVLKEHPWDPAMPPLDRLAFGIAKELGLVGRIQYLRGGNIDILTEHARGVVTVNSTTGMRALWLRRPLLALGQAIYNISGLVHDGELDSFWREPKAPDSALVEDFLRALLQVQIRGGVFTEPGLSHAVEAAVQRLQESLSA